MADKTVDRPNIIFIIDDQHRYDAISCLGHPVVRTPNIDALAADGTCYTQAVCNSPACVPSRYSFITGAYPMQTKVLSNHHRWSGDSEIPTLASLLAEEGYRTAAFGKMHWNWTDSKHGFEVRAADDFYGDIEGPLNISYSGDKGDSAVEKRMENWKRFTSEIRFTGGRSEIPYADFDDTWSTEKAIEYLESKDDSKPFFMVVSFLKPHPPNFVPADYYGRHKPEDMPVPSSPEGKSPDSCAESEPGFHRINLSAGEWQQARARYFENVEYVDGLVGKLIDALKVKGKYNSSMVCFFSDHGEMMGDRGGGIGKFSLYELSVRIPLVIKYPDQRKTTGKSDRLVELVDLAPTCLGVAGADIPEYMPGQNLLAPPERAFQFAENYCDSFIKKGIDKRMQWMIRTTEFKLILREHGDPSLYDLQNDSWECRNLYDDAGFAEIRQGLEQKLVRHIMSVNQASAQKNYRANKRDGPRVVKV